MGLASLPDFAVFTGISQKCVQAWGHGSWRADMQILVKGFSLDFACYGANLNTSAFIQGVLSNCVWRSGARTCQFICSRLCKGQAVCRALIQPVWKTASDWQLQWRRAVACKFPLVRWQSFILKAFFLLDHNDMICQIRSTVVIFMWLVSHQLFWHFKNLTQLYIRKMRIYWNEIILTIA